MKKFWKNANGRLKFGIIMTAFFLILGFVIYFIPHTNPFPNVIREKNLNTNLITFQFSGTDPVYLKKVSDEYMNTAVQKLNISIREMDEQNFNNRHREWLIVNELKDVRLMINSSSSSGDNIQRALTLLKERLDALGKNEYATAKIVDNANAAATKISRNSLIKKSAALGFVLSIMFITGRYCWRKATETGII